MSIPQNFTTLEQQVISATSTSSSVQFTSGKGAKGNAIDLLLCNGGSKNCQIAIGFTAPTAVQDASASGTTQIKLLAGAYVMVRKDQNEYVAAITEGSDTTTVYCMAGFGV